MVAWGPTGPTLVTDTLLDTPRPTTSAASTKCLNGTTQLWDPHDMPSMCCHYPTLPLHISFIP